MERSTVLGKEERRRRERVAGQFPFRCFLLLWDKKAAHLYILPSPREPELLPCTISPIPLHRSDELVPSVERRRGRTGVLGVPGQFPD